MHENDTNFRLVVTSSEVNGEDTGAGICRWASTVSTMFISLKKIRSKAKSSQILLKLDGRYRLIIYFIFLISHMLRILQEIFFQILKWKEEYSLLVRIQVWNGTGFESCPLWCFSEISLIFLSSIFIS